MNVLNVRRMSAETAAKETSGTPERGVEESTDHGTLQFALRYEAEASALVVTVVKATGLRIDDTESVNPYVKVRVLLDKHQKAKTRVVRRSVNPVFDETFTFSGVDAERLQKRGSSVHLSVFNSDAFSKDTLVAELLFPLDEVDLQNEIGISVARPLCQRIGKVSRSRHNYVSIKNGDR